MNDEQFKEGISWFRGLIRYQGDQAEIPTQIARTPVPVPRSPLRWVVAAVALLALGAIPYERAREQQRAAEQAREDALLLEKVNAGISRTVPRSMEPLLGRGEPR
jgi:hypothetical protein